jgi:hypothetical protein
MARPGRNGRQRFAAVLAVNAEIAVQRPNAALAALHLGHAHQAGVGERHGISAVALHQPTHSFVLGAEVEIEADKPDVHQREHIVRVVPIALEQEQRLRHRSFAGQHDSGCLLAALHRPPCFGALTDSIFRGLRLCPKRAMFCLR